MDTPPLSEDTQSSVRESPMSVSAEVNPALKEKGDPASSVTSSTIEPTSSVGTSTTRAGDLSITTDSTPVRSASTASAATSTSVSSSGPSEPVKKENKHTFKGIGFANTENIYYGYNGSAQPMFDQIPTDDTPYGRQKYACAKWNWRPDASFGLDGVKNSNNNEAEDGLFTKTTKDEHTQ